MLTVGNKCFTAIVVPINKCYVMLCHLSGCDAENELIHYYKEARSITNPAHSILRSWASSSSALYQVAEKDKTGETRKIVNVRGLKWNPLFDTLGLT